MIIKKHPLKQTIIWNNAIACIPESSVQLLLSFQPDNNNDFDTIEFPSLEIGIYDIKNQKYLNMKGEEIFESPKHWAYITEPYSFPLVEE